MSIRSRLIDERFLAHRRRSTATAGMIGGMTAASLFAYRYYAEHLWSWDLFAITLTIVAVKASLMAWYFLTD